MEETREEMAGLIKKNEKALKEFSESYKAFMAIDLKYCYLKRESALERFYQYASCIGKKNGSDNGEHCVKCAGEIRVVSSSGIGIFGGFEQRPKRIQDKWKKLVIDHGNHFRVLLTHPAFAHLRESAEKRIPGDIESEIVKSLMFLHCVAGLTGNHLRLYRGSPTVFLLQIAQPINDETGENERGHILINPYPYGETAMETLCLEFESQNRGSYVGQFATAHFTNSWNFIERNIKKVDGMPLVEAVNSFDNILESFTQCRFLSEEKRNEVRFSEDQINDLDSFANQLKKDTDFLGFKIKYPIEKNNPFTEKLKTSGLAYRRQS